MGTKFYVILSGGVNVYTPRPEEDIQEDLLKKQNETTQQFKSMKFKPQIYRFQQLVKKSRRLIKKNKKMEKKTIINPVWI